MTKLPTEPITRSSNNSLYVVGAVVALSLAGAAGIVAIELLRPDKDNATLVTIIVGFLAPTIASFLAFLKASTAEAKVDGLTVRVNDRMDQLLEQATKAAKAEGQRDALATAATVAAAVVAIPAPAAKKKVSGG